MTENSRQKLMDIKNGNKAATTSRQFEMEIIQKNFKKFTSTAEQEKRQFKTAKTQGNKVIS
jgi:hypothetical protein